MFEYDKYPVPPVSTLQPSYPCSSNMYIVIVRTQYIFVVMKYVYNTYILLTKTRYVLAFNSFSTFLFNSSSSF